MYIVILSKALKQLFTIHMKGSFMNFSEKELEVLRYLEKDFKKSSSTGTTRAKIIPFNRQIAAALAVVVLGGLASMAALTVFPNWAVSAIIYGFMVVYLIYTLPRIHERLLVSGFKSPFSEKVKNVRSRIGVQKHRTALVLPKRWPIISVITILLTLFGIIGIGECLFVFFVMGIITVIRTSMADGF